MAIPTFETLIYEERDHIAFLIMNRAERLNSLNAVLHRELYQAWELVMKNDDIRVAVLTGTGRAFCSGADLRERGEARQRGEVIEREKRQPNVKPGRLELTGSFPHNNMWLELEKPVICAANGLVVGAGTMLAGSCDVLIGTEASYVADAHVTYAGWPGTGEALDITDLLPWGEVFRVGTEGVKTRISGNRCFQLGFYCELVPQDQMLERATEIAKMIAAQPPDVVKSIRRVAQRSREVALRDALTFGAFEKRRLKLAKEA